jgi:cellobiose dehydrogenase (acceptor)
MTAATNRVFQRIPGTDVPSMDGKLYYQQGFNVIAGGLAASGWKNVTHANDQPNAKNHTFARGEFMFSNGERGGPMATYLVTANARSNFDLWMNTAVKKVIRSGGHITGIEVEPYLDGGYTGVVNVTSVSGRVVLSAGTFGSAKILMRSKCGPPHCQYTDPNTFRWNRSFRPARDCPGVSRWTYHDQLNSVDHFACRLQSR